MFHAYYDLACSPPTYDIIAFLGEVERERLRLGEKEVTIHFLPGPKDGFRDDKFWPHSAEERRQLLRNVAAPMCWLLPSVNEVIEREHLRPVDGFGVGQSLYGLARQVRASHEGVRPLCAPNPDERTNLVTITLRESEHWPERNSNNFEWLKAAVRIRAKGWDVVIVRDTLHADEPFGDFMVNVAAARNVTTRADLYGGAKVNMCVSNGPIWMAMMMDAPVLMFRPVDDRLGAQFGSQRFLECGIEPGGQMPGAGAHQRLVWTDDTADEIVAAFDAYIERPNEKLWRPAETLNMTLLPNLTKEDTIKNVRACAGHELAAVTAYPPHDGHAVLVGGGPSLVADLPELRRRQANGQHIFALNGTADFLIEAGVYPDYQVILDPRAENARFINPLCKILLASQCHPDVFAAARHADVRVWHFADPEYMDLVSELFPGAWFAGGGITVGLTAMGLVHGMGYRMQHLYGYDSSDAQGTAHAYEQDQTTAETFRLHVKCGDREFSCGAAMYAQAKEFPDWSVRLAEDGALITVHGDGLLPTLARSMNAATELTEGMAA